MKSVLDSLKTSTPVGQQHLAQTKDLIERLEADVSLARTSLAELEAKLDATSAM
jgi:hypothetical protein